MRKKFIPLVLFGAFGMLAKADSLTIAAQYNIFVFNDLNDTNNGISGSAAAEERRCSAARTSRVTSWVAVRLR